MFEPVGVTNGVTATPPMAVSRRVAPLNCGVMPAPSSRFVSSSVAAVIPE